MNSLDDFARLRPDEGAATVDELDDIWNELVGETSVERRSEPDIRRPTRRRFAFLGAAAVLVLGVVAIASFADRADAPPAVSATSVAVTSIPAPTVSAEPGSEGDAAIEAGEPPLWGIAENGWTLAVFEDRTDGPLDMVRLFAGPEGLATSWVAVVSGMSEPLLPIGAVPREDANDVSPISSQRVATEDGSMAVIGGGVSDDQAMSVFRAVQNGGVPPDGFVETESADAAVRTIRYRFVNEAGETIDIEVQGAGIPRYETERSAATAEESWDGTAGVDESNIAYVGDYTLLLRNGFWVSRVSTSAPADAPSTFTRLASLVQLVSPDEWDAARSVAPIAVPSKLAIGDSVMLGSARELAEAGFVLDAVESRSFDGGLTTIRDLERSGRLPETLVVDLANNSAIDEDQIFEMLELLADVDRVVFVTSRGDFVENEDNNELLRSLPDTEGNVEVVDWAVLGDDCPGDCFFEDGLHLTPDGRRFYVDLVLAAAR